MPPPRRGDPIKGQARHRETHVQVKKKDCCDEVQSLYDYVGELQAILRVWHARLWPDGGGGSPPPPPAWPPP
jgi:hypothetical protein